MGMPPNQFETSQKKPFNPTNDRENPEKIHEKDLIVIHPLIDQMFSIRPLPIISLIFATFNSVGQLISISLLHSCNPLCPFFISSLVSCFLFLVSRFSFLVC